MKLTPSALEEFKRFTAEASNSRGEQMVPALVFCHRLRNEGGTTEIKDVWGFWDMGTYSRKNIPSQFLCEVSGIELVLEDGPYSKEALLGRTIDFSGGEWNVF